MMFATEEESVLFAMWSWLTRVAAITHPRIPRDRQCARREEWECDIWSATESNLHMPQVDTEIAEPSCALDGEVGSVSEAVSELMRFHACEQ